MKQVFTEQMQSARDPGAAVLAASLALFELLTVAVPARLRSEQTFVAVISVALTAAIFTFLVAVMQDQALAMWIDKKFLFGCR